MGGPGLGAFVHVSIRQQNRYILGLIYVCFLMLLHFFFYIYKPHEVEITLKADYLM